MDHRSRGSRGIRARKRGLSAGLHLLSRGGAGEAGARNRAISARGAPRGSFDRQLDGYRLIRVGSDHRAHGGVGQWRRIAVPGIRSCASGDPLAGKAEAARSRGAAHFARGCTADLARVLGNCGAGRLAGPRPLALDSTRPGRAFRIRCTPRDGSVFRANGACLSGATTSSCSVLAKKPRSLYNLADDPAEETDLAHDREHELTRDSMLALMRQWMRKLGDGVDPSGLRLAELALQLCPGSEAYCFGRRIGGTPQGRLLLRRPSDPSCPGLSCLSRLRESAPPCAPSFSFLSFASTLAARPVRSACESSRLSEVVSIASFSTKS